MKITTKKCHACDEVLIVAQMTLREAQTIYNLTPGDGDGAIIADFNKQMREALGERGVRL